VYRIFNRLLRRHPLVLSVLASLVIISANATIRITSGSIRGGGAYVSGAAMETNGIKSAGEYLALTHRQADITNPVDLLKVAFGLEVSPDPKTPDEYRTVEGVPQSEVSREIGGELDLDQAADSAWAAANSIAGIKLDGVSSVLIVTSVSEGASALSGGLIEVDDRILSINGEPASALSWQNHVELGFDMYGTRAYGRDVELVVASPDKSVTITLPVSVQGTREGLNSTDIGLEGSIGVGFEEITLLSAPRPNLVVPARVTGPSAGLIHTLVYLDALTEGDLTGGLRIAGTGTVNSAGRVGTIGAMDHKAVAAEAAGADVLFVPLGNKLLADQTVDSLSVVPVSHVNDAIRWLCQHGGESIACYTTWLGGPVKGIPAGYEHLEAELLERASQRQDLIKLNGPR
jgi:PDZ domain-containing secreted protein